MSKNKPEARTVYFDNEESINECTKSRIVMDLEDDQQIEEQGRSESSHIDHLLETSFVQFEIVQRRLSSGTFNTNFNSGESFFQKTNQMFHSEVGNKSLKRMGHKKLQCNIGTGVIHESLSSTTNTQEKLRRLQVLKMIKLVRIIFKQMRSFKEKIKKTLNDEISKNTKCFNKLAEETNKISLKYNQIIGAKNLKILELEDELQEAARMNQWLTKKIQSNQQVSQQLIQDLQDEKTKSMAQIKDASMSASIKAQEIQEQNQTLEHQLNEFQQQIQNLQQLCNNHQILIKKLEYQKQKLQRQNQSLLVKQQALQKDYQERDFQYHQLNAEHAQINTELLKSIKMNQLYQKQLDSTKLQIKKLQQANNQISKDNQAFIINQLNRYQQFFNQEIAKIQKQHHIQLFHKNQIIDILKQKLPESNATIQKDKAKRPKTTKVFQQIDTNTSQKPKKVQIHHETISESQFKLRPGLQSNSRSQVTIKSRPQKQDQKKEKKILCNLPKNKQTFEALNLLQKAKVNSLTTNREGKIQSLIQGTSRNRELEFIFKAKEHAANLKVKLSQYMQQKAERQFFASDGMFKSYNRQIKSQRKAGTTNSFYQSQHPNF